jgi:hypothetical protein
MKRRSFLRRLIAAPVCASVTARLPRVSTPTAAATTSSMIETVDEARAALGGFLVSEEWFSAVQRELEMIVRAAGPTA